MTNSKLTKRSLLASSISLLICFAMLLGTTFAWFTDNVSTANNIITAGNLDVELMYQTPEMNEFAYVDADTNVFKTGTLWEPGHTEVVKLKVVNEGTLALKYQLGVNVVSEIGSVNVAGQEFKLSDYIKFAVLEGENEYANSAEAAATADADATALKNGYVNDNVTLASGEEKIVTMVVYMPTTVTNEANYGKNQAVPKIKLGINLYSTQLNSEEDSFGPDYDENSKYDLPPIKVSSVAELNDVLSTITEPTVIDATGVKLEPTGSLNTTVKIPAGVTLMGAEFAASSQAYLVVDGAGEDVKFEECKFDGPGFGMFVIAGEDQDGANMTFDSCTFAGQIAPNFVQNSAGKSTFTNCTFTVGSDNIGLVNCMGGEHTFNNCTFDYTGGSTMGSNKYVKWNAVNSYSEDYSTKVVLNDCTFINCGTQRFASNSGYSNTLTIN